MAQSFMQKLTVAVASSTTEELLEAKNLINAVYTDRARRAAMDRMASEKAARKGRKGGGVSKKAGRGRPAKSRTVVEETGFDAA